jgi:ribosomal protein S18 acetylase RimI-like enzyme
MNNIRLANNQDAPAIAQFNIAMALETEGKRLMPNVIGAGVANLIANPERGFYLVCEGQAGPMASLMITTEWSDWRNGNFWWIQSVYVKPEFRKQGIYRSMYEHLKALSLADGNVCGFRLYVEKDNVTAQKTYRSLGMSETDYLVYEEMKSGVEFLVSTPN